MFTINAVMSKIAFCTMNTIFMMHSFVSRVNKVYGVADNL